jgi:shikimate kinase
VSDSASRNIVLVGFMGSGKTSVGQEIAKRLGWDFVDTDAFIEVTTGRTIADIFAQDGEAAFRILESDAVRAVASRCRVVIATGGGVVLRPENVATLRANGVLVLLDASAEALYERIRHETHRPLLQVADPIARIRELLDARRPFYAQADVVLDTTDLSVSDIADEVLRRVRPDESR